jgi:hypothetical protein
MCWIVQDVRTCLIWHTKGDILHNPTHFPGSLVCRIRQVLTSCTIQHISLVPWCVRLDRFWHPVQSNTFPWSLDVRLDRFWHPVQSNPFPTCLIWHTKGPGNGLNCTGCQNLSNLTHQGTREMGWIVQDVRTCLIWHTGPLVCWIRQVPTSCTIQYISLVPWCVRLDRFWHRSYFS